MAQVWLIELLKGAGKLFLHPLFYYMIFLAGVLGVLRVKRERKDFHIRAEDAFFELRQLFPLGLLVGLCISVVMVAAGAVIPFAAVLLTAAFAFLWSLTGRMRLLAPVYTVGAAFFALIFLAGEKWPLPLFSDSFSGLNEKVYPSFAVLLALLVIGEGILISGRGWVGTSPKLMISKRGQRVGVHVARRLWMLPVLLVIPGEALQAPFEWWPAFNVAGESYSLLAVPFTVGFHQQIQGMLPKEAVRLVGKKVLLLGIAVLAVAAGGYWFPVISIGAVALALIGREAISIKQRLREDNMPFYFSKRNQGLMILGLIPDSPASKMGLQIGELITKANGVPVRSEKSFYEALQRNRAHCKLEVLDTNGQIRFVQRALYEGDHHQLGILFVQERKKWGSAAG